jgi:Nuclease-related domain
LAQKLLNLRRPDTCAKCATPLPAGTTAYWLTPECKVICLPCGEASGEAGAGTSAQAEFDRRRRAREKRAQERGRIFGFWARLSEGPQHERAWAKGAAGERTNARNLERRLSDKPVRLLHDRHLAGRRSNIDHIAIGRSGVMVVDSKNLAGKVKVERHGGLFSPRHFDLYVGGRKRTGLVENVERQVETVRSVLAESAFGEVPVHGALCMADVDGLPLFGHPNVRGVAIDGTRYVAKQIARPGPLDANAIARIAAFLDQRFPAA